MYIYINEIVLVCKNTKECSMTYRQSETYSHKMPQKLITTACFIHEESSGGEDSS